MEPLCSKVGALMIAVFTMYTQGNFVGTMKLICNEACRRENTEAVCYLYMWVLDHMSQKNLPGLYLYFTIMHCVTWLSAVQQVSYNCNKRDRA